MERGRFPDTEWNRIRRAAHPDPQAMEEFCLQYRPPVLAYLERQGFGREDAEDLCQQVFLRIVERRLLQKADPSKGLFRSFVLGITRNVLREALKRKAAAKRGGGEVAGSREAIEAQAEPAADEPFDRLWTAHLIERAMRRLRESPEEAERRYHALLESAAGAEGGYERIAAALGLTPTEVRNGLHRARQRLRELLEEEVRGYATSWSECDTEARYLSRFLPKPRR
jgi:RNA polymerase sigma-70 factor (ECF subfamily)